jgi:hypothetical protein
VLANPPPAVLTFDFSALHSGDNLFGTVGDVNNALIVIGEHPVIGADGKIIKGGQNPSDTISTSQGGGPTTIGVNSQMFDPGEGAHLMREFSPFVATDAALKILLNAETCNDGSLLARAPPAVPGRGCS